MPETLVMALLTKEDIDDCLRRLYEDVGPPAPVDLSWMTDEQRRRFAWDQYMWYLTGTYRVSIGPPKEAE